MWIHTHTPTLFWTTHTPCPFMDTHTIKNHTHVPRQTHTVKLIHFEVLHYSGKDMLFMKATFGIHPSPFFKLNIHPRGSSKKWKKTLVLWISSSYFQPWNVFLVSSSEGLAHLSMIFPFRMHHSFIVRSSANKQACFISSKKAGRESQPTLYQEYCEWRTLLV